MNKYIYNGKKIAIGKDYVRLKKRNILVKYSDIRQISIKNTRLHRYWFLFIISGILALSIILILFILFIRGLFSDTFFSIEGGLFYRKRTIILLLFFFIGGPFFIIYKIKKYFRKYSMLVIKWNHHDFRIKTSELGISVQELKLFFDSKLKETGSRSEVTEK